LGQWMMPRKIRLTTLQRDILWLLEEAGEETTSCVIASVRPPDRESFDSAVSGLVGLGYLVRAEVPDGLSACLCLTKAGRKAFTTLNGQQPSSVPWGCC